MFKRIATGILLIALTGFLTAPAKARLLVQGPKAAEAQKAQGDDDDDPIPQLFLTPEQREKIRAIREQTTVERMTVNQRLREAKRALQDALDVDNPDEALVEQRLHELAAAQAAQMRMRVLTEVRIRRVLTPEQQAILRGLRGKARDSLREGFLENRRRQREGDDGPRRRNQRNGLDKGVPSPEGVQRPRP